jgi:hypothetical protein
VQQGACITFCLNLGKNVAETLAMIRQAFREDTMIFTWVFEWKVTGEKHSQAHARNFL